MPSFLMFIYYCTIGLLLNTSVFIDLFIIQKTVQGELCITMVVHGVSAWERTRTSVTRILAVPILWVMIFTTRQQTKKKEALVKDP